MGIRVTSINTPVGGVSWEYTGKKQSSMPLTLIPEQKIKVFVSSICGDKGRYDKIRAELKQEIERTNLATVYLFEAKGAATISAGEHYTYALEDSDICIFLIDNADGIASGVQNEIDTVRKRNIKALYYFCDETSTEKTPLEQSLMGARFSKCKTIHSFGELSKNGAQDLINDIIAVYHYYCAGRLNSVSQNEANEELQSIDVIGIEKYQLPIIPKMVLKNVDKSRNYILKLALGYDRGRYPDEDEKTSENDEWCVQFLPILFEGETIKHFNTTMFLDMLKEQQDSGYFNIVQIRWQAIQSYFAGDIEKCFELLQTALKVAKESNQPTWVIKDILIDIRNQHWTLCTVKNQFYDPPAQKELTESNEEIYYPIIDRIHESLNEKYMEGLYKNKTNSPYSVTIGNNLDQFGELLASSLIVSMYNGSLTHILLLYDKIKDFVFYLCCRYDDWKPRLNLYKFAVYEGKEKDIKGLQDSYPEILNNMTAADALSVIEFCKNRPMKHDRINSMLLAFGAIGYFLDDESFKYYEKVVIEEIDSWLNSDVFISSIGQNIFKCLSGVAHRMSQDELSIICCKFIEKSYSRFYTDMFKFIANKLDLNKMSLKSSENLIEHICRILDSDTDREQIKYSSTFLCVLRNQNADLTEALDKKISKYFPEFYNGNYKLETTKDKKQDMPVFVREYIDIIRKNTETQGKNGMYFGHGTREIATVRAILLEEETVCEPETMDLLISAISDVLLISKEGVSTKLDAISLLLCITQKYPDDFKRNKKSYENLYKMRDKIEGSDCSILSSNIDDVSIKIALQFLYAAIGNDVYGEMLELLPNIKDDVATTTAVERIIVEYLEVADNVTLPVRVESIVLQNVLQWLQSENLDIRWMAVRILFALSRNDENNGIVNSQLIKLIDTNNVYIKNLILRHIMVAKGVDERTKEYIIFKCENDANYVVRMVCKEIKGET